MTKIVKQLLFGIAILLTTTCAQAQDSNAYVLAVGDVISIHVFEEPDLSIDKVEISDTGKIQYPPLGEIQATGRTTAQLKQAITAGLTPDYLVDARVSIIIVEYRPYFLNGEVMKPGSYPYKPGIILRQAITIAGDLTERASKSKMTVISSGKTQTPVKVEMDYEIKPGDTITIGESFF